MSVAELNQNPPTIDLDKFTSRVFKTNLVSLTINDIKGLQGELASKVNSDNAVTLTNKSMDAENNVFTNLEDDIPNGALSISQTENLQSSLDAKLATTGNITHSGGTADFQGGINIQHNTNSNTKGVEIKTSDKAIRLIRPEQIISHTISVPGLDDVNFFIGNNELPILHIGNENEDNILIGRDIFTSYIDTGGVSITDSLQGYSISDDTNFKNNIVLNATGKEQALRHSNNIILNASDNELGQPNFTKEIITRQDVGFYVKPIAATASVPKFSANPEEGRANCRLLYNEDTGEVLKYRADEMMSFQQIFVGNYENAGIGDSNDLISKTEQQTARIFIGSNTSTIDFYRVRKIDVNLSTVNTTSTSTAELIINGALACETIFIISDERIKTNMTDLNDDEALTKFRLLQPKSYNYKDTVKRTQNKVYGFSAQQIREVLPDAVKLSTNTIPNIYANVEISGNLIFLPEDISMTTIELNMEDENGVAFGVIEFENAKNEPFSVKIIEKQDENKILVMELSIANEECYYDETQDKHILFCYGQQVEDLHRIDKSAIYTLTTSAVQEIDRIQQRHQNEIELLKAEIEAIKQQLI